MRNAVAFVSVFVLGAVAWHIVSGDRTSALVVDRVSSRVADRVPAGVVERVVSRIDRIGSRVDRVASRVADRVTSRVADRVFARLAADTPSTDVGAAFSRLRQGAAGQTFKSPSGATLKVLVDENVLGGTEVEIAELTLLPNSDSGDHRHAVTETFYLLEGDMEQVINGKPVKLTPGLTASIRSTDQVRHKAGPKGAKVLVIWAPGGEIARVTGRWKAQ